MIMKLRLFVSLFLIFGISGMVSCQLTDAMEQQTDTTFIIAKIIAKPFVNKKGVVFKQYQELYLVVDSVDVFIKHNDNSVLCEDLFMLKDSVVKVKVVFKEGLWDNKTRYEQSRIGKYVEVLQIIKAQ